MLDRNTVWRVLVVVLIALFVFDGSALAQRRRRSSRSRGRNNTQAVRQTIQAALQQAQAQAAVAQQALAVASQRITVLTGEESSAKGRVDSAVANLKTAEDDLKNAEQNIRAIQEQLESSQPSDSPLAEKRRAYEETKKNYEGVRDQLIHAPDYQARYQAALKGSNRLEEIPKLQKEILEHRDLLRPRIHYDAARQSYEQERSRLFAADSEWTAATEATRSAQSAHAKATVEVNNGRLKLGAVRADLKEATKAATVAQAALLQAQGAIAQLSQQGKRYGLKTPTPSYSTPSSGKR